MEPSRAYLELMVDAAMSQQAIAKRCGIGIKRVRSLMDLYGLQSKARPGVVAKPAGEVGPVHGTRGQEPAKLMPSAEALRAVSVFNLGRV